MPPLKQDFTKRDNQVLIQAWFTKGETGKADQPIIDMHNRLKDNGYSPHAILTMAYQALAEKHGEALPTPSKASDIADEIANRLGPLFEAINNMSALMQSGNLSSMPEAEKALKNLTEARDTFGEFEQSLGGQIKAISFSPEELEGLE